MYIYYMSTSYENEPNISDWKVQYLQPLKHKRNEQGKSDVNLQEVTAADVTTIQDTGVFAYFMYTSEITAPLSSMLKGVYSPQLVEYPAVGTDAWVEAMKPAAAGTAVFISTVAVPLTCIIVFTLFTYWKYSSMVTHRKQYVSSLNDTTRLLIEALNVVNQMRTMSDYLDISFDSFSHLDDIIKDLLSHVISEMPHHDFSIIIKEMKDVFSINENTNETSETIKGGDNGDDIHNIVLNVVNTINNIPIDRNRYNNCCDSLHSKIMEMQEEIQEKESVPIASNVRESPSVNNESLPTVQALPIEYTPVMNIVDADADAEPLPENTNPYNEKINNFNQVSNRELQVQGGGGQKTIQYYKDEKDKSILYILAYIQTENAENKFELFEKCMEYLEIKPYSKTENKYRQVIFELLRKTFTNMKANIEHNGGSTMKASITAVYNSIFNYKQTGIGELILNTIVNNNDIMISIKNIIGSIKTLIDEYSKHAKTRIESLLSVYMQQKINVLEIENKKKMLPEETIQKINELRTIYSTHEDCEYLYPILDNYLSYITQTNKLLLKVPGRDGGEQSYELFTRHLNEIYINLTPTNTTYSSVLYERFRNNYMNYLTVKEISEKKTKETQLFLSKSLLNTATSWTGSNTTLGWMFEGYNQSRGIRSMGGGNEEASAYLNTLITRFNGWFTLETNKFNLQLQKKTNESLYSIFTAENENEKQNYIKEYEHIVSAFHAIPTIHKKLETDTDYNMFVNDDFVNTIKDINNVYDIKLDELFKNHVGLINEIDKVVDKYGLRLKSEISDAQWFGDSAGKEKKGKIETKVRGMGYYIGAVFRYEKSKQHQDGMREVKDIRHDVKLLHDKVRKIQARSGCYEIIENNYRTNYIKIKNQNERIDKLTAGRENIENVQKLCVNSLEELTEKYMNIFKDVNIIEKEKEWVNYIINSDNKTEPENIPNVCEGWFTFYDPCTKSYTETITDVASVGKNALDALNSRGEIAINKAVSAPKKEIIISSVYSLRAVVDVLSVDKHVENLLKVLIVAYSVNPNESNDSNNYETKTEPTEGGKLLKKNTTAKQRKIKNHLNKTLRLKN